MQYINPSSNNSYTHSRGYSLVELAIVLLVIGLLLAVIMGGRAVLHTAKIQATIQHATELGTAIEAFRETYGYLPGDHPSPEDHFNNPVGYQGTCCAGDGNDILNRPHERATFWWYLSQAGLVDEALMVPVSASAPFVLGEQFPASPLDNAGWLFYVKGIRYHPCGGLYRYEKALQLGGVLPQTSADVPVLSAVVPIEVHIALDQQIDNGDGPVRGLYQVENTDCISVNSEFAADQTQGCIGLFFLQSHAVHKVDNTGYEGDCTSAIMGSNGGVN